jgi:hypothetical protein
MITLRPSGRMGNRLNYFITGMYLHETKKMRFVPERISGFKNTYNVLEGESFQNQLELSTLNPNLLSNIKNTHNVGFIVDIMINRYEMMKDMDIKRYLEMDEFNIDIPEKDELVIHIRLGDYKHIGCVIDIQSYLDVIEVDKNNISKVTIVTDSPSDPVLNPLRNIGCEIRCKSEIEDFFYIKSAKRICISNSTFSWTAAFISDADIVYWPISNNKWPYFANPTPNDADMRPLDRKNWIYL